MHKSAFPVPGDCDDAAGIEIETVEADINNNVPVKAKEDNEADKITRWEKYFQTILNRPELYVIADILAA